MAKATLQRLAPAAHAAAGGSLHVTSKAGTRIGYERVGSGPNLILVSEAQAGWGQSLENLARLIEVP